MRGGKMNQSTIQASLKNMLGKKITPKNDESVSM